MTIPIIVGWPQVILFIIGLVGLILFISAVRSLRSRSVLVSEEDKDIYRRTGVMPPPRRHFRWLRGISGIVLMVLAVSLLWMTFLVQSYLGLTGDIRVAHVHATPLANVAHEMSVELLLYDSSGKQVSDKTYLVQGDEWMLQGDIIKFPTWLNVIGLHSGYKLTRLEGRYDNSDLERHAQHTVIDLNGGDGNFFKVMNAQRGWISPFIDATYGNAVFEPADGTYNVFVSQTGLYAKLV